MNPKNDAGESDRTSPKEMQGWLEREIADAAKAMELRVKDATRFVTAYSRGEISAAEADKQNYAYSRRWGEALPEYSAPRGCQMRRYSRKSIRSERNRSGCTAVAETHPETRARPHKASCASPAF